MIARNFHRHGVTSVIAMMYLVLFASMAVGFYASSGTAVEISANEQEQAKALGAAESGLDFMRFQMAQVIIPPSSAGATMMNSVYTQLATLLNGTQNMKGAVVQLDAGVVSVPGGSGKYISLDDQGTGFQAKISQVSDGRVRIQVMGQTARSANSPIHRGVQLEFSVQPDASHTSILKYGVASHGLFNVSSSFIQGSPDPTRGEIFTDNTTTTTPVKLSGSAVISGDVMMGGSSAAISGSGSVAGISDPAQWGTHVQNNVPSPEFPAVDPSPFVNYLVGKETLILTNQSGATLSNIRIKANSNVQFSGCTINGVILIEVPNKITFSGGTTKITGVMVVDKPTLDTTINSITISGGGTISGPENLPASYGELRNLTGSAILAPQFNVNFSGGSSSIGGNIVAKNAVFSGGSGGTVNGSVILTGGGTLTLSGGSGFTIGNATSGVPAGMRFSGPIMPLPTTYDEIKISGW